MGAPCASNLVGSVLSKLWWSVISQCLGPRHADTLTLRYVSSIKKDLHDCDLDFHFTLMLSSGNLKDPLASDLYLKQVHVSCDEFFRHWTSSNALQRLFLSSFSTMYLMFCLANIFSSPLLGQFSFFLLVDRAVQALHRSAMQLL